MRDDESLKEGDTEPETLVLSLGDALTLDDSVLNDVSKLVSLDVSSKLALSDALLVMLSLDDGDE